MGDAYEASEAPTPELGQRDGTKPTKQQLWATWIITGTPLVLATAALIGWLILRLS